MKKTILAIHGAGMHAGIWGGLVPHLLDYYFRPVSLPGHDTAQGGEPLSSISAMADWTRKKLSSAEAGSHILLGHSMGALIALEAADDPAVAAIVLLGAAAAMPVNEDLLKTAAEKPEDAAKMIIKWSVFPGHPQFDAVKTVTASVMQSTNPRAVGMDLAACNAYADGDKRARRIDKPVLVISGAEDKMARKSGGESLAALMQNGTFSLLPDCGHMMMVEKPIETALEIKNFIAAKGI